jgi:photosystem II stability/assembly factor-like uncharacterized protein
MEFVNTNTGYMSGGLYSAGPHKFFKTTNGGNSWVELNTNMWRAIVSQEFIDVNTGYLGIMHEIYKTSNGGENWNKIYENPHSGFDIVSSIKFHKPKHRLCLRGIFYSDTTSKSRFVIKLLMPAIPGNYLLNDTLAQ